MIYSLRFSKKNWYVKIWCGVWLSLWEIRVSSSSQWVSPSPCSQSSNYWVQGGAPTEREREREGEIHLAERWLVGAAMFVVNIQSSPASDQSCWTVASRGERVCQVWLWLVCSLLIFNLNSLQFGCNTEAKCSQPRTPQSYSSVWEKTESSSM